MKVPGRPLEWLMVAGVVMLAAAAAVLWAPTAQAPLGRELPLAGQAPASQQALPAAASASSPLPYSGEAPAAPPVEAAPAPVQAAPRAEPDRMLIARDVDSERPSAGAQSSAFSGSAQSYQGGQAEGSRTYYAPQEQKAAVQLAVARPGDLARPGAVRYGSADRAELMGRGAGPVYNLKSNRGVQAGAVPDMGVLIQQASTIIEGAKTQIQNSSMDQKQKDQALGAIHSAEAGLPGR